jgi:uncharacterized Zn finger protein
MARWDDDDRWWRDYPRSTPLAAKGGIKARTQRGDFAASWWGRRWIGVLESFGLGGRLTRGRSYARRGQVVSLEIVPGVAKAVVQGSRPDPYQVRISFKPIEPKRRPALVAALTADMSITARLIGGELPPQSERCFEQAGLSVFPKHFSDLVTSCSCPDSSNPCKHIAAVFYILAEELDRDPFTLLALHGLGRDEFMELIAAALPKTEQTESADHKPVVQTASRPMSRDPQAFWKGSRLPDLTFEDLASGEQAPLARRLGAFPLWRGNAAFLEEIGRLSSAAAARAVEVLAGWGS